MHIFREKRTDTCINWIIHLALNFDQISINNNTKQRKLFHDKEKLGKTYIKTSATYFKIKNGVSQEYQN